MSFVAVTKGAFSIFIGCGGCGGQNKDISVGQVAMYPDCNVIRRIGERLIYCSGNDKFVIIFICF